MKFPPALKETQRIITDFIKFRDYKEVQKTLIQLTNFTTFFSTINIIIVAWGTKDSAPDS
jgi:hypothetical protein